MPTDSQCPRCLDRAPFRGSAPKCAFPQGKFVRDNWNCATMNALRDVADKTWNGVHIYDGQDESAAMLRGPDGGFVLLRWYKNRGRTDEALYWRLGASGAGWIMLPLTLAQAEQTLKKAGG